MSIERVGLVATRWGIPISDFLDAAKILTGKQCLRCNIYAIILKKIGVIGYDKAEVLIKEIIEAKNDIIKLTEIKKKLPK